MGDKGRRDIGKTADTPVLHFANAAPVSAWSHAMKHDNSCTRHYGDQAVQFFRPQKPAAKNSLGSPGRSEWESKVVAANLKIARPKE